MSLWQACDQAICCDMCHLWLNCHCRCPCATPTLKDVDVAPGDADFGAPDETVTALASDEERRRSPGSVQGAAQWLHSRNHSPGVVALVRRARRMLPGDPDFGDPLSTAGEGGPRAAARAAGRLLGERGGASREVSLGALQVWQALTEAVSPRPADQEGNIVFPGLVGFSL